MNAEIKKPNAMSLMSLINLILENTLSNILIRLVLNISVIFVLVKLIYYKYNMKNEHLFSFSLIGIIIFFICSILDTVDIHLGMAIGLFAVFAILRFRTVNYSVKDMTYIFVVIGVSIINSLANIPPPLVSAFGINAIVLTSVYLLELFYQKNTLGHIVIIYNNIELLPPSRKKELIMDLSKITGLNVINVKVIKINISSRNFELEVFFRNND